VISKRFSIRSGIGMLLAGTLVTVGAGAGVAGIAHPAPAGSKVTVRFSGANNGQDVRDGGVAGTGRFTASGAIADKGTSVVYRTMKGARITLRYVGAGRKGTLTFIVRIDTNLGTSRWTIASGTKAYKGLQGTGIERENADYTVSTLTGTVTR
jgi:hypothetical protein